MRFCLWILYQEQRVSPSSPPPPPPTPLSPIFALVFIFVLQLMRGNVHGISSGSKLRPHVYAFTSKFNIYHKNPLLSQALALYTTKQGKQAANSFISFNTLESPGGHWQQRLFGQRNFQTNGGGGGDRCWVWCLATILWRIIGVPGRWKISCFLWMSHMSSGWWRIRSRSLGILGVPVRLLNAIGARMLSGCGHIARSSMSYWFDQF